eukprot:TRINITY_DN8994_c0_g1_i1.p1 TRINITY_DN8994_c0_g1~~TRINITY_DN8994_c0_g1_i1.p1  ORF type:complete len:175 (+),score=25.85 TRINITY_DN8994_c0_g1_i1:27-527(+)
MCIRDRCGMAFLDFTACFALWCALCNCAFCAYCQKSCRKERNDGHSHVARCEYNIAPRKSIFASRVTFEHSQNLRRVRSVTDYLQSITDTHLRQQVLDSIARDLSDLGIVVNTKGRLEAPEPPNLNSAPSYGYGGGSYSGLSGGTANRYGPYGGANLTNRYGGRRW